MKNVSNITKGGLYVALSILCLYLSTILPTSKLFLLCAASAIIPLSIITTNVKNSFIVYLGTVFLTFILGLKAIAFAYGIFFGSYCFVKYYVERLNKIYLEVILKLLFFNATFFSIYYLYSLFFTDMLKVKLPLLYVALMLQLVFCIYDYSLTLLINYINNRLLKLFK